MTNEFSILLEKYFKGEISAQEEERLEELLKTEENLAIFDQYIEVNFLLNKPLNFFNSQVAFEKVQAQLGESEIKKNNPRFFLRYAAVLIVILLSGASYFLMADREIPSNLDSNQVVLVGDNGIIEEFEQSDIKIVRNNKGN